MTSSSLLPPSLPPNNSEKAEAISKIADEFYSFAGTFSEEGEADEAEELYADSVEVGKLFKKTLADYRRVVRTCEYEGLGISNETAEFKQEFAVSESIANRMKVIAGIQNEIKTMMDACDRPPKDIVKKYAEADLVSRIENGVMEADFEVQED